MDMFKTAVILAGGTSGRMGFDKQFLEVKGKRLLDILIEKLKLEFTDIIIVSNKPDFYNRSKYQVISDEIKNIGPLGGVHAALKATKSKFTYFTACDMPYISINYIKEMKKALNNAYNKDTTIHACVSIDKTNNMIEPFNAFYSIDLISDIEAAVCSEILSLRKLLKKLNVIYVEKEEKHKNVFLNLNTQEDLKKVLSDKF